MSKRVLSIVVGVLLVGSFAFIAGTRMPHNTGATTNQSKAETNVQPDAAKAQTSKLFEELVAADNASSKSMLESLYSSTMRGGEISEECAQQVQKRADRIAQVSTLDVPSGVRDSYLKLLEAENNLVRAVKTFEYGRLQLQSDQDILNSSVRLQNYQQVSKWEGKVEDGKRQTRADRGALLAALDEVTTLEKGFKAVAPAALKYEMVYSGWQDKIKQDAGNDSD